MKQVSAEDNAPMTVMLDRAREISAMVHGRTSHDLSADRMFQLAVLRLVSVIRDMVDRVRVPGYDRHAVTVWPDVVREYDTVDNDVVWHVITEEIPMLLRALERAMPGHQGRPR